VVWVLEYFVNTCVRGGFDKQDGVI